MIERLRAKLKLHEMNITARRAEVAQIEEDIRQATLSLERAKQGLQGNMGAAQTLRELIEAENED